MKTIEEKPKVYWILEYSNRGKCSNRIILDTLQEAKKEIEYITSRERVATYKIFKVKEIEE